MSSTPLNSRAVPISSTGLLPAIVGIGLSLGGWGATALPAEPGPGKTDRSIEKAKETRTPSFRTDVAPLLSKAGCNMGACHGNLNGKGGFKLSLRGDDPSFDYQSLTHDQSGRRISRVAPASSLIVLKPTGAIPHEGGLRFARDSIEAQTLLAWIAAGAMTIERRRLASKPCVSFPPSGSWRPAPSTSSSSSPLRLTMARPATSRARRRTTLATRPAPRSPLTGRFTPAVLVRRPSPFAT